MSTGYIRPIGAGASYAEGGLIGWTYVDEDPASDADSISSNNGWTGGFAIDIFALSMPQFYGTINSVTLRYRAMRSITGYTINIKGAIYVDSTYYYGTLHDLSVVGSWTDYSDTWTTNPSTGVAWTWEELLDLQAGFAAQTSNTAAAAKVSQVYIDVDYNPVGVAEVITLMPNGAGDVTQLSPSSGNNYECVDEETANDDSDYVYCSASTKKDLYTIEAATLQNIMACEFVGRFRMSASDGPQTVATIIKSGGSENTIRSDSITTYSTSWVTLSDSKRLNPVSGVAWTPADIAGLQVGPSLANSHAGASSRCTQIFVRVLNVRYPVAAGPQLIGLPVW